MKRPGVWLVRHGETEWSASGRHTGSTDLPLTDVGRAAAAQVGAALADRAFVAVLTSPLRRARDTCEIAGQGSDAVVDADLREWDYGDYEGLTTAEIRADRSGWSLWRDGCPRGESAIDVGRRSDGVIDRLRDYGGAVCVFAHGHVLRVLAARWVGLPPQDGALLALDTATISALGWEREQPVIREWNLPPS